MPYFMWSSLSLTEHQTVVAKQVEQLTTDPKFEGSNPTTAGSGEKDR